MKGLAQLAGIWCNDRVFLAWLEDISGHAFTPDDAVELIHIKCNVSSRRELETNHDAAAIFLSEIRAPFMRWRAAHPEEVAKY
ncbi:hypothetical protein LV28_12415 [Pandoraea pnomenusa]|uniref:Uncharacterized protein n=2 Tax=Pandoraea pnomenusa TaxID=93220 RepID=A0A379KDH3_9BURK|nr:hypothetical protein [Pandoraea pnomenusa]AIU27220.1 hypothetical protein LV28_12415 [Pandoraea pnomenusa]SUA78282.1 Uncharacterised protein [Pandoraea pnomenusa]SUD65886.1 Uncharacterised protein [Pandoraea pnomenusa]